MFISLSPCVYVLTVNVGHGATRSPFVFDAFTMALAAIDTLGLSQHVDFCPPPLHIQKKPRRATFRRRIFHKPTCHRPNEQRVYGPLDDIIDEIRSNI